MRIIIPAMTTAALAIGTLVLGPQGAFAKEASAVDDALEGCGANNAFLRNAGACLTEPLMQLDTIRLAKKEKDEEKKDKGEKHKGKKGKEGRHQQGSLGEHLYNHTIGDCKYKYKENKHGYKEEYKCKSRYKRKYKKNKYKYESNTNGCKYKYEESAKGYKEEYKCKKGKSHVGAGGGYWPKYGKRGPRAAVGAPFGIDQGSCNRELLGAAVGAGLGGLAGSKVGDGTGQLVAVAVGTFLGAVLGAEVGRSLDELDEACAGQALDHAGDNETVVWENPDQGARYELTPSRSYNDARNLYCREYQTVAIVGGRRRELFGRACRQPDGSWKHMN